MNGQITTSVGGDGLADILERVLDKGIVITGDVAINLVGIELLTIKLRLMITTVDKAMELGINWWQTDPALCSDPGGHDTAARLEEENRLLRGRLAILEKRMADLTAPSSGLLQEKAQV